MQVILQEDIDKLGNAGDIVVVKAGYARNFLLPKNKAVLADTKNVKQLEHQKKVVATKQLKVKRAAEEIATKLKDVSITIAREVGEEEKIFGSVTTKDIHDALRNEGHIVDRYSIKLDEPIKQLGIFDVSVKLHSEVMGVVKVWVVKK
jgi:large subunit ribosomal protein L9